MKIDLDIKWIVDDEFIIETGNIIDVDTELWDGVGAVVDITPDYLEIINEYQNYIKIYKNNIRSIEIVG